MARKTSVLSSEQYAQADAEAQEMLKNGMPSKLEDKIALLRKKLDKTLEATPISQSASNFSETSNSAQDFATAMRLRPTSVFNLGDPCNQAMLEGVAAITIGVALGPHGALVGFGVGVYLLTQSCHEG